MTKVQFRDGAVEYRITLNGRFAGTSVAEVRQAYFNKLDERRSSRITVDISALTDYDAAGRKLLRDMYLHGVHFAAATPASLVFLSEISSPRRGSITMLSDLPAGQAPQLVEPPIPRVAKSTLKSRTAGK